MRQNVGTTMRSVILRLYFSLSFSDVDALRETLTQLGFILLRWFTLQQLMAVFRACKIRKKSYCYRMFPHKNQIGSSCCSRVVSKTRFENSAQRKTYPTPIWTQPWALPHIYQPDLRPPKSATQNTLSYLRPTRVRYQPMRLSL